MSHETSDPLLQMYADISGCAAISVGYRLAPEHPFPAGPDDCYDAAEWLADNAEKEYGGPLRYIGGEVGYVFLSLICAMDMIILKSKLRDFYEDSFTLSHDPTLSLPLIHSL